ncbi:MAG: hypothetical protein NTV06_08455 [candidate division Zixibacteria bacterium]|nr:hypothetical protein [candidate division Zixibacteria bacterium]
MTGNTIRFRYLAILFAWLICIASCGTNQSKREAAPAITAGGDEAAIRASLEEWFDRLKEGDMTVMYENEFSYYKLDNPLSKYLELDKIKKYPYGTLKAMDIDSVKLMGDSALVYLRVTRYSNAGGGQWHPYRNTVYRSQGRWIKPAISRCNEERDYLEQKRIYDSVTAGE